MKSSPLKLSWRFKIGTILLLSLTIHSSWQSFKYNDIKIVISRYDEYGTITSDKISQFEEQLTCLRVMLSPNERVGFLSPLEGDSWTEVYFLTKYALAPTIVTKAKKQGKMIAVYPGEQNLEQVRASGFTVLLDCNNGIGLVRSVRTP